MKPKQTTQQNIERIINEALGETSALFMQKECKGTEIIMPDTELSKIANTASREIVQFLKLTT